MPPKKGRKRKAATESNGNDHNGTELAVPDRETWLGWVEMESEPAFFNVMLKDMGVRGAKVQEVYSLDEEMLAVLPRPIHALIFLFKYRETENEQSEKSCPKHIWFANQVPDFACATIALLNIVNNVQGLEVGKEIRDFKKLTTEMSPLQRGDAIDDFTFVKRIHNSFARDVDILNADALLRDKAAKAKKRAAAKRAAATRKAKLEDARAKPPASTPDATINGAPTTPAQKSSHPKSARSSSKASNKSTRKAGARSSPRHKQPSPAIENGERSDTEDELTKPSTQERRQKNGTRSSARLSKSSAATEDGEQSDAEYKSTSRKDSKTAEHNEPADGVNGLRRSARKPKPRKEDAEFVVDMKEDVDPEDVGFHFIAYMPIGDHVWKLDGMDSFPQDLGTFPTDFGDSWLSIAQPALQARMLQYEASEIQFNLMAVCHDALIEELASLAANIKALESIDAKLDKVYEDWRAMDGADTPSDVLTGPNGDYSITKTDVNVAKDDSTWTEKIHAESDLLKLIELRQEISSAQGPLRAAVRDGLQASGDDDEKARQRRHDYTGFVKGWLGALADREILTSLLEE